MDHRTCRSCRACPFHHVRARSGSRSICLRRQCDGQRAGFRKRLILRESTRRGLRHFIGRARCGDRNIGRSHSRWLRCFCARREFHHHRQFFGRLDAFGRRHVDRRQRQRHRGGRRHIQHGHRSGSRPERRQPGDIRGGLQHRHWRWRWRWSDSSEIDGKPERRNRWKHGCAQQRQHCRGSRELRHRRKQQCIRQRKYGEWDEFRRFRHGKCRDRKRKLRHR